MPTGTLIGLLCQVAALALLWRRLRYRWTAHIGAIFVVVACTFHGLGEILIAFFPGQSPFRPLIQNPADLHEFVAAIGATILVFSVVYLICLGPIGDYPIGRIEADLDESALFLDWRILLVAALPLLVLTARGAGYNGVLSANNSVSTATGLSLQFILLLVPLAAFGFVGRHGRRWLLPTLLIQCAVLALIGQREEIIIGAVALLYATGRYNIRLARRHLLVGLIVVAAGALVVTSARANTGRSAFNSGGSVGHKLTALAAGVTGVFDAQTRASLRQTAGYRLDGNTWGALVIEDFHQGGHPAGPGSIANDLTDAVPSFLDPVKNDRNPATLDEQTYQGQRMNLPVDSTGAVIGITPTQLGIVLGYWGIVGLLCAGAILGGLFGLLDRWLSTRRTPVSLVLGVGFVICAGFYERTMQEYPDILRGVLVLLVAVKVLHMLARYGRSRMGVSRPTSLLAPARPQFPRVRQPVTTTSPNSSADSRSTGTSRLAPMRNVRLGAPVAKRWAVIRDVSIATGSQLGGN